MEIKPVKVKSADLNSFEKPPEKNRKLLKIILISLGALVVCTGVVILIFYSKLTDGNYDSLFADREGALPASTVKPTAPAAAGVTTTTPDPGPVYDIEYNGKKYIRNENIVNILFLGIDTNTQRRINMEGYRSDMIMVCAIDTETKKVTLISIPRDTKTTVYKLNEKTGEVTETVQYKINTAYSYGGGIDNYSFKNASDCVQMFLERRCQMEQPLGFMLDVPVNMYASMDIDGIQHIAASVGGVKVKLDTGIPGVGRKGQTVTLKYANAETYLRDRHHSGGDLGRDNHQQTFMIALAKKIKSMGAVDAVMNLYDDMQRYVYTNLNTDQILDLAEVLSKVDIDSIEMITIPGEGRTQSGTWFYLSDEAATLQILLDVYYNEVAES